MYFVRAARWHLVEVLPPGDGAAARRCSVCAYSALDTAGEVVLDPTTQEQYRRVCCKGCGDDLLEPLTHTPTAIASIEGGGPPDHCLPNQDCDESKSPNA
jgi:hypothetical protein